MANPGDFAYTLKQQADIVRIVGEYITLRKAGAQNFSGLCPFHQEKTPSFSVHTSRQFFHCFGCGASGDVFSFVQKIENITFPEAVRLIADKLKIPMPKMSFSSPEEERTAQLRGGLIDIHERACTFFQEQLRKPEAAHAREYLVSRGITPEVIAEFRMGFAPDSGFLLREALRNQYEEELLRESGLFSWKDKGDQAAAEIAVLYSRFRNRVMFPICNETGKVIAFTGRTLSTDEKAGPKYLNSPETPIYSKSRVLFNLDKAKEAIRKLDYAILVEGQMDCIAVYAAGFRNVIASSGTAFTESQARLMGRFSKNIVVNFDPDTAGAAAAERSLALLVSEDFQIKVLTLDVGFDPDLYIRRKGPAAYGEALAHSQKYFNYLTERARELFPPRTPEAKVKAINYLLPYLQQIPNAFTRTEILQEMSQKLALDSEFLRNQFRQLVARRATGQVKVPEFEKLTESEEILLQALVCPVSAQIRKDDSREPDPEFEPAREALYWLSGQSLHKGLPGEQLLGKLLDGYRENRNLMELALTESERTTVAEIGQGKRHVLTPENVRGAIIGVRKAAISRRLKELQVQIDGLRPTDRDDFKKLWAQREELKLALKSPSLEGVF